MLFNEPKLLKSPHTRGVISFYKGFSALQRAEIAEIAGVARKRDFTLVGFSALQRAEIAEIIRHLTTRASSSSFSALQRAEIAEISALRLH